MTVRPPVVMRSASRTVPSREHVWSDVALGVRLALGGGRTAWLRVGLTTVGVGLCVLVLLLAASVGPAMDARDARASELTPYPAEIGAASVVPAEALRAGQFEAHASEAPFRGDTVIGLDLAALDPSRAAPPPGVPRFPAPGELFVSPALAALLAEPDATDLRARLGIDNGAATAAAIAGTIAEDGLRDPAELRFYRGAAPSTVPLADPGLADGWGGPLFVESADEFTTVLLTAGTTIVIVPLLIFVSLMSRLGAATRDRRSAAIRLIGASAAQLRRITLTETALAAVAGLVVGGLAFLAARQAGPWLRIGTSGFFPADITPVPSAVAVLIVGVPMLAIGAVWLGSRATVVEPLGVVRSTRSTPRRLSWRLGWLVIGGVAMLGALYAPLPFDSTTRTLALSGSIVLMLTAVPVLLPWVLERVVRRLPASGTGWQLAIRRLQLDPGMPARVVGGISVVVAGAIALQSLLAFGATRWDGALDSLNLPDDALLVTVEAPTTAELTTIVDGLRWANPAGEPGLAGGVTIGGTVTGADAGAGELSAGDDYVGAVVAPCAALGVPDCRDGQVFGVAASPLSSRFGGDPVTAAPGDTISWFTNGGSDVPWTVPDPAATVPAGAIATFARATLIVTPGALGADADAILAPARLELLTRPDPTASGPTDPAGRADVLRADLADLTWRVRVQTPGESLAGAFGGTLATTARTGLLLGAGLTVLVAALGLLVTAIEQLTERRRALTLTVASGVPRAMIARSLLIGAAIPIVVGMLLAMLVGSALTIFLLELLGEPWGVDLGVIASFTALGIGVVLAMTLATLPSVARLTRPEALRTS